jgi:hypothetical protein
VGPQQQELVAELGPLPSALQKKDQFKAYGVKRDIPRMVEGQTSDLYASDTNTWTATSSVQSLGKEPTMSSHSPSGSHSH